MVSWSDSHAGAVAGLVALCLGTAACGGAPDPSTSTAGGMELTWVYIDQYNIPTLADDPEQPSARLVTGNLTVVFRRADHPATLVLDFETETGQRTHNELDLAALNPDIPEATEGRWRVLAPLKIPELGALQFTAVLVDQLGRTSGAIGGSFTVGDGLGGNNGGQVTEGNTTGNTTTVSGGS
ncbi:MAG: hypothetical protein ACOYXU_11260 [Nitrospirota bacterium]